MAQKKMIIGTPNDLEKAIMLASAKDVRICLLRIAQEMLVEQEGQRYTLNPDKDLSSADVVQEVTLHLQASGFWPSTVRCSVCGNDVCAGTAHLHQDKWIGDECCWDERLKSSE